VHESCGDAHPATREQVQCTSAVPTLSVDKCDGVLAYIPQALADNPDFQVRCLPAAVCRAGLVHVRKPCC
jgi:hypothetical protein